MNLPKNERRMVGSLIHKKLWIYGQPYTGKSMLADQFPEPLMLNTDGNVDYLTSPYVPIRDTVEQTGRIKETKMAWEVFKETVDDLAKMDNSYKTIVVDLVEDVYEACRQYIYKKNNISHESDDPYRAWDKVRSEFLAVFKKLTTLPYENIVLISHEDISKDITKKSGDKVTAIKPNITDKVALKLAGMVGLTCRTLIEDGEYLVKFKTEDSVEFGGGRFKPSKKQIHNSYEELCEVYKTSQPAVVNDRPTPPPQVNEEPDMPEFDSSEAPVEEPQKPVRKKRQATVLPETEEVKEEVKEEVQPEEKAEENNEKPVRRQRKHREEN